MTNTKSLWKNLSVLYLITTIALLVMVIVLTVMLEKNNVIDVPLLESSLTFVEETDGVYMVRDPTTALKLSSTQKSFLKRAYLDSGANEYQTCMNTRRTMVTKSDSQSYDYFVHSVTEINDPVTGVDNYVGLSCKGYDVALHKHPLNVNETINHNCNNKIWTEDMLSANRFFDNGGLFYTIQCSPNHIEVYTDETRKNGVIMVI